MLDYLDAISTGKSTYANERPSPHYKTFHPSTGIECWKICVYPQTRKTNALAADP